MAFKVQLEQFDGPLHVLLEIIQKEELPITDVSLAQVAEDYLKYVEINEVPTAELADFLIVATKLLLIKSQSILPAKELDKEIDTSTLALQLRLYKEFVEASKTLEALYNHPFESFGRHKADVVKAKSDVLETQITPQALNDSFTRLMKRLAPFFKLQTTVMERVVSVKVRLEEIREAILSRAKMTFRQIASQGKSKVDIVVSFLALLELVKQQSVNVVQSGAFDEIEIKRVD
jgi:segregation and condensation protein A